MYSEELKKLESRVDDLIDVCDRLKRENTQLRAGDGGLRDEHERLRRKTEQARTRIQSMIERLKALERA
jgi:cell division protein ZapB